MAALLHGVEAGAQEDEAGDPERQLVGPKGGLPDDVAQKDLVQHHQRHGDDQHHRDPADEQRHPIDRPPFLKLHVGDAHAANADDEQDRDQDQRRPVDRIGKAAEQTGQAGGHVLALMQGAHLIDEARIFRGEKVEDQRGRVPDHPAHADHERKRYQPLPEAAGLAGHDEPPRAGGVTASSRLPSALAGWRVQIERPDLGPCPGACASRPVMRPNEAARPFQPRPRPGCRTALPASPSRRVRSGS